MSVPVSVQLSSLLTGGGTLSLSVPWSIPSGSGLPGAGTTGTTTISATIPATTSTGGSFSIFKDLVDAGERLVRASLATQT